jgi:tRNA A-37 threonylcarbamoyl transferase component Bud32
MTPPSHLTWLATNQAPAFIAEAQCLIAMRHAGVTVPMLCVVNADGISGYAIQRPPATTVEASMSRNAVDIVATKLP